MPQKEVVLTQEVVHVHALAPTLLVPDLVLVLEVADDLRLAGQRPDESAAVWRREPRRERDLHVAAAVPLLALLVHLRHQVTDKLWPQ